MKQFLLQYLHFTKTERYGIAALAILTIGIWLSSDVLRYWHRKEKPLLPPQTAAQAVATTPLPTTASPPNGTKPQYVNPNTATAADWIQLGLPERVANTIVKYRSKGGYFRKPEDLSKIYSLSTSDYKKVLPYLRMEDSKTETTPIETSSLPAEKEAPTLFTFDPNQVSEADLLRLGLPAKVASNIVKYREKGGKFKQKTDLLKIYDFPAALFPALEPHIQIAPLEAPVAATNAPAAEVLRPVMYSTRTPALPAQPAVIDINTAALDAWISLPGVGIALAKRIVNFREKLGGFERVEQVGETYGVADSVFQDIRLFLTVRSPIFRSIDLNTVDLNALSAHPYFDYKQARLIVAYREQHGSFKSVDDLDKIQAFRDKAWLAKVKPYLAVGNATDKVERD